MVDILADLSNEQEISQQNILNLNSFLQIWDENYHQRVSKIAMFNPSLINQWSSKQISFFIKVLYHVRGHFHDVLWYLGNFSPNEKLKKLILSNISDEFNGKGLSHEQLYILFAHEAGVDLSNEFLNEEFYLPCIKEFNRGHLEWMRMHDWQECYSFFSALERLDNVDYRLGKQIAENLGLKNKALAFFNIHINAKHYNVLEQVLIEVWENSTNKVKNAFEFVGKHQTKMWQELSDAVFSFND